MNLLMIGAVSSGVCWIVCLGLYLSRKNTPAKNIVSCRVFHTKSVSIFPTEFFSVTGDDDDSGEHVELEPEGELVTT